MKTITSVFLALVFLTNVGGAQSPDETVEGIRQDANYQKALVYIENDHSRFVEELIELTEIPAPPFKEEQRAQAYMEMLRQHGLIH